MIVSGHDYFGTSDVYLGKGSVGEFFKKVGKFTSPFTTAIAKTFLPPGVVDMAAKLDPSKRAGFLQQAQAAIKSGNLPVYTDSTATSPKPPAKINPWLVGGAAVAGLGVVLLVTRKRG